MGMAERVAGFGTTIFAEINVLAAQHNAVNLGQGAPDFETPPHVIEAVQRALTTRHHQYAPGWGYPELREAIAAHSARFYGMSVDPASQITITNGATEGIFASMLGLINPGDEVIFFEPFYDSYVPSLNIAGGVARYVPLHPPHWTFDPNELRAQFSPRTRAIMINTPHNPTGKIFTRAELTLIAELCQEHDALAITDEVYEHIVFDGREHVRMATLPGMENRTVTLSSLGKTFSATGWKIGWAIGAPEHIAGIFRARQFISFAVAAPLQWAAVEILNTTPESYYAALKADYQRKRDYLYAALAETPLQPLSPEGGYFIMADTSACGFEDDRAFAEYLIREIGVAPIPPASFYSAPHKPLARHLARFSICKADETLQAAVERLRKLG